MKSMRLLLVVLFLALLTASLVSAERNADKTEAKKLDQAADKITWLDYAEGKNLAGDTTKHLLLNFTASWCGYCKKMDRETFSSEEVIDYVNQNFIPVKVWGDSKNVLDIEGYKISEKDLAGKNFNVRGFPTFYFEDADGERLGPLPGYQPKENFMKVLNYVATKEYEKEQESTDK